MADEYRTPDDSPDDSDIPPIETPEREGIDANADDRAVGLDAFLKGLEANDRPLPADPPPLAEPPEIGDILDQEMGGLPDDFQIPAAEPVAPDAPQTPQEPLPVTSSEESTQEPPDGPKAADSLLEHLERFGNFEEDAGQDADFGGAQFPSSEIVAAGGDSGGGGGSSGGESDGGGGNIQEALDADYSHRETSTDYLVEHIRKINELTARLERERL